MDGDDDDTIKVNAVQVQFMQLYDMGNAVVGDEDYYDVDTQVDSISDSADDDISRYITTYPMFDTETTVKVDEGMDADHLVVTVNGAPYAEDDYSYDPETGYITIPEYPAMVQSVTVAEEDTTIGEKLMSFLDSAIGVVEANAVTVDNMAVNPNAKPVTFNPKDGITSGTYVCGEMSYSYHANKSNPGWVYDLGTSQSLYDAISSGTLSETITVANNDVFSVTVAWGSGYSSLASSSDLSQNPELYIYTSQYTKGNQILTDFGNWGTALLECDHSSTDAGSGGADVGGYWYLENVGMRFFEVNEEEGYALVGIYTAKTHTQSGYGLYKYPITPSNGYLTLQKSSDRGDWLDDDTYSLEGAEYTVYTNSGCETVAKDVNGDDAVLITDKDGKTNTLEMDVRTYYVKETKASPGHSLDKDVHTAKVTTSNTADSPLIVTSTDPALPGYLYVEKKSGNESFTDGNSNYSYENATYYVYTDASCTTRAKDADNNKDAVLTTVGTGKSNTIAVKAGTYYVKEQTASAGYGLDTEVHEVTVEPSSTSSEAVCVSSKEPPTPVYVSLVKTSANSSVTDGNACYSLEGAVYYVYTDSSCKTVLQQIDGSDAVLTTDANGNTNTVAIPAGTWYVKEAKASEGYLLCDEDNPCANSNNGVHTVSVTFSNTEGNPAVVRCEETPGNDPGGISLYKLDAETGEPYTLGDADLSGAQFTIKYYDGYYDETGDLPEEATRTWVVETKMQDNGTYRAFLGDEYKVSGDEWYYAYGTICLPLGTYTVQETLAPDGYLLEDAPGSYESRSEEKSYEAPVHLSQVTLEDNAVVSLHIGNAMDGDNELTATEPVKRFDISLMKHEGDAQEAMGSVEFMLTSLTTGESHCFWTDEHGKYSSSSSDWNPHSDQTNAAEDEYDGLWFYGTADEAAQDAMTVDDSVGALPYDTYRLDEIEGENNEGYEMYHTTFTAGAGHDYAGEVIDLGLINNYPPDDDNPYIHTEAWAGDTGTQVCYVGGSGDDGWVTLYDNVYYYNLEPGVTYGIYGVAVDVDTREPEYDHYGNEICAWTTFVASDTGNGMEVQKFYFDVEDLGGHRAVFFETVFELSTDEDGNIVYDENGSPVRYVTDGDGNVVYDENGDPEIYFYVAEDPDDYENLTIYFPQVGTELTDSDTGEHFSVAEGTVTLTDRVAVTEVPEGETVTIVGTLHDKGTGLALVNGDGSEVTASDTYVSPGLETWYADLVFTFDESALTGNGAVAYEDLYLTVSTKGVPETETLIGRHADLDDEDQTVYFPSIYTTAVDSETHSHVSFADGEVTVIDTVEYKNLVEGETYTMSGVLMDKDTGEALRGDDGYEITAEATFVAGEGGEAADADAGTDETAEEETATGALVSGSVEMAFTFPAETLAGKAAVAFEYLYLDGTLVTEHTDLTDESQTVWFPAISTTATDAADGDGRVDAGSVTVNDRVDYTGLEAGKRYVMAGTLMRKATGEAVLVNGEAATAELAFTPETSDGYVTLSVAADTSGMEGESLVMFEKCYSVGDDGAYVEVAAHEDLDDKAQTVKVKSPVGSGGGTVTTGLRNFGLIAVIGAAALAAALALIRRRRRAW